MKLFLLWASIIATLIAGYYGLKLLFALYVIFHYVLGVI